jgi:hypothetical protein
LDNELYFDALLAWLLQEGLLEILALKTPILNSRLGTIFRRSAPSWDPNLHNLGITAKSIRVSQGAKEGAPVIRAS